MIAAYLPGKSVLHRLPAGVKLAGLAIVSMLVLPLSHPLPLALGLALVIGAYAALGPRALARLRRVGPLVPLLVLVGALQIWSGTLEAAASSVLRIVLMVLLADLVTATTTLDDMQDVLERLFAPLRRIGFEPRHLSLAVALVLRFVPVLLAQWQARTEAWRARSTRRPSPVLVAAFFTGALRMADRIAEALDARGFSARRPPREPT